jgi:hypothetical protein
MSGLFDSKKKPKKKPTKQSKSVKAPKRYRYSYDDLYNLPEDKLEWFTQNGFPEEQDMARGIRAERKRMRLATYGY